MLFYETALQYLNKEKCDLSPYSVRSYYWNLKKISDFMSKLDLAELKAETILEYKRHMQMRGNGPVTINKGLSVGGVLFVKHNTRTILARDLTDVITDKCTELDIPVYKTTIREGVAIREAQTMRKSIFEYAPKSKPAQDYKKLIEEIGL